MVNGAQALSEHCAELLLMVPTCRKKNSFFANDKLPARRLHPRLAFFVVEAIFRNCDNHCAGFETAGRVPVPCHAELPNLTLSCCSINNGTTELQVPLHAPIRRVAPAMERVVRIRFTTDDAELADLLDRILDKGLFLGSANLLTLGHTNLSTPKTHISLASMQTNTDRYASPPRPLKDGTRRR